MRGRDAFKLRLGGADNDFAESPSFTDASKSGGKLLEGEGAVDVDPDLPGDAHELIPGGAGKRDLSAAQARRMLAGVRPRDPAGATRRRLAMDLIGDLEAVDEHVQVEATWGIYQPRSPSAASPTGPWAGN